MCMYCERRKDVNYGWNQPEIPTSGNLDAKFMHVQIMDYQSAQPEMLISSKELNECLTGKKDGIATIIIPANYCIVCGRKLGDDKNLNFEQHPQFKNKVPPQMTHKDIMDAESAYRKAHPGTKSIIQFGDNGKPESLLFYKEKEPHYNIRLVPHTIRSLEELIRTPRAITYTVLRKYADLTARLLMSIDQNMLLSIRNIRWTDEKEGPTLNYDSNGKPIESTESIVIRLSDVGYDDYEELFRQAALRTLIEVRRLGLKNPLLNPAHYPKSDREPENVRKWAEAQMDNIQWPNVMLSTWGCMDYEDKGGNHDDDVR